MTVCGYIFLVLIGLCWGSFLNVVIVRTLSDESIILPPSKCPKCNNRLLWWHKIPLLSYALLKGKCGFCSDKISVQYPIVELLGAGIFLFSFINYGTPVDIVMVIIILSMFLVLACTDIKEKKISIPHTLIVSVCGVIFNRYDILNSLTGFVFASGMIILLSLLSEKFLKKQTFGNGDVYAFGALGAVVGADNLIMFLIYAVFIQFLYILPEYIKTIIKDENKEKLKYFISFVSACLFFYVFRNINFWGSKLLLTMLLGVVVFCGINIIKNLLISVKTGETHSCSPILPSLAICALIFLC